DYENYGFDGLPKKVWELLYPRSYWPIVRRCARANHLDPYVVMGLIRQESAFNPRATSSAGARGLMQMMPQTVERGIRGRHRSRRAVGSLYSPAYNIRVSCRYLRDLLRMFGGNTAQALAAYNAGDARVKQWVANGNLQDPNMFPESVPFVETRAYVESILRDAAIYRALFTGTARFSACGTGRHLALSRPSPGNGLDPRAGKPPNSIPRLYSLG
ncbi:MAG: lytic transglycosylase domain-containing protein, partial [Terriglobia bacterium]